MIPKKNRLTAQDLLQKQGWKNQKSQFLKAFLIKTRQNKTNVNRFGVVISKKVSKLATDRNRIKRNIYDSIADIDNISNDILFIVNKEAVEMSKNQIKQEISTVFPHK